MNIALIGNDHPLLLYRRALPGRKKLFPWSPAEEMEPWDALCFLPSLTLDPEAEDPEVLLPLLEVPYSWLHLWVEQRKERGGVVLYVLTLDGVFGCPDLLLCERDSALLAQARAMALELGRYGIRVNTLVVGPLLHTPEEETKAHRENPLRRCGSWREAAEVLKFFLSPGSAHITGEMLVVAGGAQLTRAPV